jgi:hypothetical protein
MPNLKELSKMIEKGDFDSRINDELANLMSAIKDFGKGGTLTIKYTIKPDKDVPEALKVTGSVKARLPEPRSEALLFTNPVTPDKAPTK